MAYAALQKYITHLYTTKSTNTNIWINDAEQAQGRYFQSTLTSVFQAIRSSFALQVVGYQGLARSYLSNQETSEGLSLWRLLDHAANDDESIELDRLCRLVHAINFYRQPQAFGQDLYLNVHSRLLAAIQQNHGASFRHILDTLELPHQHIVLELPAITANQRWIMTHVADNYRRNGFRIALNLSTIEQGIELVKQGYVDAVKLDSSACTDLVALTKLLKVTEKNKTNVIIKRLDNEQQYRALEQLSQQLQQEIMLQGFLFDQPASSLFSQPIKHLSKKTCTKCHVA
jgi:EAL domain-containing protein (putative c-di-GMP-specific phosphodiesterase class I)